MTLAALVVGLSATLAACGGDEVDPVANEAVKTAPETWTQAPADGTGADAPAPGAPTEPGDDGGLGTVSPRDRDQGDYTAPAAASAPGVPKASGGQGIFVKSVKGFRPEWSARVSIDDDELCVDTSIPGNFDPDPFCNTGTLLALRFFSDAADGHAVGSIALAPLSRREEPTRLVVTGLAAGDVKKVTVVYAGDEHDAALSDEAISAPVDRKMARSLSGATQREVAKLPGEVTVRAFGVAFERDAGNPPATVTARTVRPVKGEIVLDLS